ncbi:MAG: hypothetical protein ACE145_01890 [Terriglobia bacterium]
MVKHRRSRRIRTDWFLLVAGTLVCTVGWGAGVPVPQPEAEAAAQTAPSKPAAAPAVKPKAAAPKKTAVKKAAAKKTSVAPTAAKDLSPAAVAIKRDPFKLPGPPAAAQGAPEQVLGPLPPGSRGLLINQLRLEGIVRLDTTNTMIAVVDNNTNRAYFLRENDAVYDGVVSKITPDSVTFKQNYSEPGGPSGVRDVVKRLSPGPGEGR